MEHFGNSKDQRVSRLMETNHFVMAGLVPAIHVFGPVGFETWTPGSSPGVTERGYDLDHP